MQYGNILEADSNVAHYKTLLSDGSKCSHACSHDTILHASNAKTGTTARHIGTPT